MKLSHVFFITAFAAPTAFADSPVFSNETCEAEKIPQVITGVYTESDDDKITISVPGGRQIKLGFENGDLLSCIRIATTISINTEEFSLSWLNNLSSATSLTIRDFKDDGTNHLNNLISVTEARFLGKDLHQIPSMPNLKHLQSFTVANTSFTDVALPRVNSRTVDIISNSLLNKVQFAAGFAIETLRLKDNPLLNDISPRFSWSRNNFGTVMISGPHSFTNLDQSQLGSPERLIIDNGGSGINNLVLESIESVSLDNTSIANISISNPRGSDDLRFSFSGDAVAEEINLDATSLRLSIFSDTRIGKIITTAATSSGIFISNSESGAQISMPNIETIHGDLSIYQGAETLILPKLKLVTGDIKITNTDLVNVEIPSLEYANALKVNYNDSIKSLKVNAEAKISGDSSASFNPLLCEIEGYRFAIAVATCESE
ncbi:MAG: hypothetical protein HRU19_24625 [Pseudobacteriovorax sp.]|nr:hypothetical protein [Pseudobacteriovorax sp.]